MLKVLGTLLFIGIVVGLMAWWPSREKTLGELKDELEARDEA